MLEAQIVCGRDRTLRIMRSVGIRAVRGYKPPKGYYDCTPHVAVSNEFNREFEEAAPNRWWVSDITHVKTHEGFLFVAVVMDLYAHNIVG